MQDVAKHSHKLLLSFVALSLPSIISGRISSSPKYLEMPTIEEFTKQITTEYYINSLSADRQTIKSIFEPKSYKKRVGKKKNWRPDNLKSPPFKLTWIIYDNLTII